MHIAIDIVVDLWHIYYKIYASKYFSLGSMHNMQCIFNCREYSFPLQLLLTFYAPADAVHEMTFDYSDCKTQAW